MPRSRRVRDAAIGLIAVLALVAIVVGVPAALVRFVGWPLPTIMPTIDAVGAALRYGRVDSGTVLKALAVVVWTAWLLVSVGILVELVAMVRGTVARTFSAIAGVQRLSVRLLTAALLLSTLTSRPAAAVTPAPVPPLAPPVDPAPRGPTGEDRQEPADDTPTWVVQRRDSLWTIAERALGDGRRWREIRDLNVGHAQPGGGRLHADDVMIHPGWVLRLPPVRTTGDRPRQVVVEPGDHLWGLAETHLGDGRRWHRIYDRNQGVPQPDGRQLTRPDLILPGWELELPGGRATKRRAMPDDRDHNAPHNRRPAAGDDHHDHDSPHDPVHRRPAVPNDHIGTGRPDEAPVPPLPLTPSTLPADPASSRQDPPATDRRVPAPTAVWETELEPAMTVSASRSESVPSALPVTGVALLAAGLVGVLARRRRQWLRRRRPGSALEPVDAEAAELERWLRAMADHDLSHRTDRLLRLLAEHFAEHGVRPRVLALELGERVRLLLSSVDLSPPPGITASEDGRAWLLDAELEVAAPLDENQPRLMPALVGCGRRETGEMVALNLVEVGLLDVVGPPSKVQQALTSWTAELASTGAAAGVELIVVGAHHHLVEEFARVTIAGDAHAALTRVERALDAPGAATSCVVVLGAAPTTSRAWEAMRRRALEDPRLVLVGAHEPTAVPRADHRLELDGDRVLLQPHGVDLAAPEWLTPETWERFGDLLRQPVRENHSDLVPSPLLTAPLDRCLADVATADLDEPSVRLVRVLGPLVVDGITTLPPLVGDLLAYLAVHTEGATADTLAAQLGPRHPGDPSVQAALEAAQHLHGPDDDRLPLVTVDHDGRFRLADGVGSDIERFRMLTRRLDHLAPARQAGQIQAALALVQGPPLCDSGAWAHAEGLVTATAALISDVAHRLATLVMTFGDLDRATWAVDRGLLANPGCELLYRDRLRIADARGDHRALDAIMRDLRAHARAEDGWMTPETLQLFERLKRSTTITAAPGNDADERRHAS